MDRRDGAASIGQACNPPPHIMVMTGQNETCIVPTSKVTASAFRLATRGRQRGRKEGPTYVGVGGGGWELGVGVCEVVVVEGVRAGVCRCA